MKVSDSELTEFITEHKGDYPIRTMCEALDIPKSTYYQSLNKTESNRDRENNSQKRLFGFTKRVRNDMVHLRYMKSLKNKVTRSA